MPIVYLPLLKTENAYLSCLYVVFRLFQQQKKKHMRDPRALGPHQNVKIHFKRYILYLHYTHPHPHTNGIEI